MTTEERLTTYIGQELLADGGPPLQPDDNLLLSGRVDSIGVMSLLLFIETEMGVRVPPEDVTIDHFASVRAIDTYLAGRQNGSAHG
ncbi:MAG: acyl carrier protein [Bacteroidota bacterium]